MNRREFSKNSVLLGVGALAGCTVNPPTEDTDLGNYYEEPAKKLPISLTSMSVYEGPESDLL